METRKYCRTMLSLITGLLLTVMAYSQSGCPAVEEKNKTVNEETVNTISRPKEEPKPMSIYGGLILYKVELESRTSLSPYAQENTPDYKDKKENLVGLMVFNKDKNKQDGVNAAMPDGVYVWDGEQWLSISLPLVAKAK